MTSLDWIIVIVLSISGLLGLWRGLVRELFSVAGWIAAVVLAVRFATPLGASLPDDIPWPVLRTAVAAAAIGVACIFGAALLGALVHRFVAVAHLSGTDRMLGGLFGLLRGALIVFAAVLLLSRTALAQQPAWREAILVLPFDVGVRWLAPHLPAPFGRRGSLLIGRL
jgi:membrane protein required for colicin V production